MEDVKKILAINFGGIGDEILFLPTLNSLKKEFTNASITLALEPRSKGIKDLTDTIDDVFTVDIKSSKKFFETFKLIKFARQGNFDVVVSSGGNKLISIILFLTGIKRRYGYDTGALSRYLLTEAVPLNRNQYACDMYHDLITPLTNIKTYLPEIKVKPGEKEQGTILIHPGVSKMSLSKGIVKTIQPEIWAKVIDLFLENNKHIILAGGPDDDECIKQIVAKMKYKRHPNFLNYYGQTKNLVELAELIASADKFICSDSAPLHIAVALKTKTYVIFGPTDFKKLIPTSSLVVPILASDNCELQPCLWEKRLKTCDNQVCLDIKADKISEIILSL